jgi:hypothetical protein
MRVGCKLGHPKATENFTSPNMEENYIGIDVYSKSVSCAPSKGDMMCAGVKFVILENILFLLP